jgi:amidase
VLASLGHQVEERTPDWNAILVAALGPMNVPGPAGTVGLDQLDLVEPRNRPLVERGATYTVVEHAQWIEQCRAASLDFLQFWDDVDVLLTPTCGMLPPSVDWAPWSQSPEEHMATFMTFPNFAQPFNLSGQPALSLPLAWSTDGLPIGMQLAGRRFEEATLLRLAGQLEQALPWADRRPALVA